MMHYWLSKFKGNPNESWRLWDWHPTPLPDNVEDYQFQVITDAPSCDLNKLHKNFVDIFDKEKELHK